MGEAKNSFICLIKLNLKSARLSGLGIFVIRFRRHYFSFLLSFMYARMLEAIIDFEHGERNGGDAGRADGTRPKLGAGRQEPGHQVGRQTRL